jgi:hypothetical protein
MRRDETIMNQTEVRRSTAASNQIERRQAAAGSHQARRGQPSRTCETALQRAYDKRIPVLDLSGAKDAVIQGAVAAERFAERLNESNSYGTGSRNIYVSLAATGVAGDDVIRISAPLQGFSVVLNISHNPQINDSALTAILQGTTGIVRLNLTGTRITDASIQTVSRYIQSGESALRSVVLDGTNVTQDGINELRAVMNNRQVDGQNTAGPVEGDTADAPPIAPTVYNQSPEPQSDGEKQIDLDATPLV